MKKKYFIIILVFPLSIYADTVVFNKTFGGSESEFAYSIQQTTDEGYIVAGTTSSYGEGYPSIWIIKLDTNGDSLWTKIYEGTIVSSAHSIQQTTDGGYIVAGQTDYYGAGRYDMWILKLDENGNGHGPVGISDSNSNFKGFSLSQNHPNPFNPVTHIDFFISKYCHAALTVYNVAGQKVKVLDDSMFEGGNHSFRWDATNMPNGLYFYTLKANGKSETRKMMLVR